MSLKNREHASRARAFFPAASASGFFHQGYSAQVPLAHHSPAPSSQFLLLSALRRTSRSRHLLPHCRERAALSLPRVDASATKPSPWTGPRPAPDAASLPHLASPASGTRPTEAVLRRRSYVHVHVQPRMAVTLNEAAPARCGRDCAS